MVVELKPRIVVFGVGGAGGNAVNNMIESGLQGVDFVVANTDSQSLLQSKATTKIQLGVDLTQGLGAGAQPDVGEAAAEESLSDIVASLENAHMAFIAAGMGGGTGTGAAPVIARAARERGVLTVGVVTKPFDFEGRRRMTIAEGGVESLRDIVDTLIIIPNQNLFRIADANTTLAGAFTLADEVLHAGVRGITDLMVVPGLINLDFADVKTVMQEMGSAMMGTGEADGDDRATRAAEAAINNPLLDDVSMRGARGVLINITGGPDMTLFEVDEAANLIRQEVDPDAQIILGSAFDPNLNGKLRVSVVATGISEGQARTRPAVESAAAPAPEKVAVEPVETVVTEQPVQSEPEIQAAQQEVVSSVAQEPAEITYSPSSGPAFGVGSLSQEADEPDASNTVEADRPRIVTPSIVQQPLQPDTPEPSVERRVEDVEVQVDLSAPVLNPRPTYEEAQNIAAVPTKDDQAEQSATAGAGERAGFTGLFGWRRGSDEPSGDEASKGSAEPDEDDLEIPAFLRRQP